MQCTMLQPCFIPILPPYCGYRWHYVGLGPAWQSSAFAIVLFLVIRYWSVMEVFCFLFILVSNLVSIVQSWGSQVNSYWLLCCLLGAHTTVARLLTQLHTLQKLDWLVHPLRWWDKVMRSIFINLLSSFSLSFSSSLVFISTHESLGRAASLVYCFLMNVTHFSLPLWLLSGWGG